MNEKDLENLDAKLNVYDEESNSLYRINHGEVEPIDINNGRIVVKPGSFNVRNIFDPAEFKTIDEESIIEDTEEWLINHGCKRYDSPLLGEDGYLKED